MKLTWKSKLVLTALFDTVTSVTLLLVGRWYPHEREFLNALILAFQPLVGLIVLVISGEAAGSSVRSFLPMLRRAPSEDDKVK